MKLELKHLAPYLPYGLKVQCKRHWIKYGEQHTLEVNGIAKSDEWQYEFYNGGNLMFSDITAKGFKPILRPLSQLTETIEHNGEKFVPIERLTESENGVTVSKYTSDNGEANTVIITYKLMGDTFTDFVTNRGNVTSTRYEYVVKLLEWHFDVFGLIENNLAIAVTD